MKRKLLAALCVTAMSAGLLAGCGSSDKTEESTKTEETAKEETSSQEETETKVASSDSDNVASEEEAEKAGFSDGSDEKSDSADTDSENKDSSDSSTTSVLLDTSKELTGIHHAEIEVKDYGTIDVELDADTAPITVTNFVKLAQEGFYDGLTFHRIMDGFMIQGFHKIPCLDMLPYKSEKSHSASEKEQKQCQYTAAHFACDPKCKLI